MKKFIVVAIVLAGAYAAAAGAFENWVLAAEGETGAWWIRPVSFVARAGIFSVTAKAVATKAGTIDIMMMRVSERDCLAGQGTLVISDLSGANRKAMDFAFRAGNVTSASAEMLCALGTMK